MKLINRFGTEEKVLRHPTHSHTEFSATKCSVSHVLRQKDIRLIPGRTESSIMICFGSLMEPPSSEALCLQLQLLVPSCPMDSTEAPAADTRNRILD